MKAKFILLAACVVGLAACTQKDTPTGGDNTKEEALQKAVTPYVNNTVVATYSRMADAGLELLDKCEAIVKAVEECGGKGRRAQRDHRDHQDHRDSRDSRDDLKSPKDLKVAGGASTSAAATQSTSRPAAQPTARPSAQPMAQSTSKPAARPQLTPEEQRKMMDDPKLNALLAALPGAKVTAIK